MRVRERISAYGHRDGFVGVQGLNEIAAHFRVILVDDRDRYVAQELVEIGLRIKDAVKNHAWRSPEDAAVVEDATHFGEHCSPNADARKGRLGGRRLGDAPHRGPGDGAEAQPAEPEQDAGEPPQDQERLRGARCRQSAHRLVKQDLDVPAQRQQVSPEAREGAHSQQRKADARKAKSRIAEDCGEAQADRELACEELQQAPERKIGDDQKACGGAHQHRVASKGNAVELMDDAGVDDHHHDEDREERRQFPEERRQRTAAGGSEPGSEAPSRELRTDRISGGDCGDDVKNGGQDGAQEKLRVVERRVGQNVLLDHQGSWRIRRFVGVRGSVAVAAAIALDIADEALLPGVKYWRL